MEVVFTPGAKKDIKKLRKVSQIIILEKLKKLEVTTKGINIEKMGGFKNTFRIRVGNFRIVYRKIGDKFYVVLVGHRKDVYDRLKRLLS